MTPSAGEGPGLFHTFSYAEGIEDAREIRYKRDVMHTEEMSEFCTVLYAAERTGLAVKTWYQGGADTNNVRRVRFGRSIRLVRADVENFIKERIEKSTQIADLCNQDR